MDWLIIFLVAAAAIALGRIAYQLRNARNVREDDWDTKLIERLRRSGVDTFKPMNINFFVALPDRSVAESLATRLQQEGFVVDVRDMPDSPDQTCSVHAAKILSLNVPAIRGVSARLRELASAVGGRYDGWAPGKESGPSA
jgi:hypothetical protein